MGEECTSLSTSHHISGLIIVRCQSELNEMVGAVVKRPLLFLPFTDRRVASTDAAGTASCFG